MTRRFFKRLIKSIEFRLNTWRYSFLNIPGMMGYQERMNLFNTCFRELKGKGIAVEFGAFLGASTGAIQHGLRNNRSTHSTALHVVDCFRSSLTSEFSIFVRDYSRQAKLQHLLKEKDGWLSFYDVFKANVDVNDTHLIIHHCFLSDLNWSSQPVEFLHLDLPKDWNLAAPIAERIFPDLVVGAKVLFQDFGYQWSAELIAVVGLLIEMQLIKPYRITDTTLSVSVVKLISNNAIVNLKHKMDVPEDVLDAIEIARVACAHLDSGATDATLYMAKSQYLYSQNRIDESFSIMAELFQSRRLGLIASQRLADLFQKGFVADKSYEKKTDLD